MTNPEWLDGIRKTVEEHESKGWKWMSPKQARIMRSSKMSDQIKLTQKWVIEAGYENPNDAVVGFLYVGAALYKIEPAK